MRVEAVLTACLQASLPGIPVRPDVALSTDVTPYIVYSQFTGDRVKSLAGDSGLANPRFQIDVYSLTKADCIEKKSVIRDAVLSSDLLGAVFIDEGSGYESDTKLFRQRQDFSFWFYD